MWGGRTPALSVGAGHHHLSAADRRAYLLRHLFVTILGGTAILQRQLFMTGDMPEM